MSADILTSATIPLLRPVLGDEKPPSPTKQSTSSTIHEPVPLAPESSWRVLIPTRRPPSTSSSWPEPELSIGLPCSPLGRNKCWEVVGSVREISRPIFRGTKDILDQHAEFLHETERIPFSIMFGMYMIGRSESRAHPTLVISCESKKPRQKAMKLVRDSGILRDYPGVLLAECSQSPTTLGQVRPLGSLGAADTEFVYFSPPTQKKVCGKAIYVMESHDPRNLSFTSISKKSTIGGFVRLNGSQHDDIYCGLTVTHAFEDEREVRLPSTEVEFSFDGLDDDNELDCDSSQLLAEGNVEENTGEQKPPLFNLISKPDEIQNFPKIPSQGEDLGIGSCLASSLDGENPGLDWALIEIIRPHTQQANFISIDDVTGSCLLYIEQIVTTMPENQSVVAVTSSGVQSGVLSGSTTYYKSPYGGSFEEVWTVRFDGRLERGDSGCWVINPVNGDFYGHIVAGCPESRVGYLIPATRIFKDIRRQLGAEIKLATRSSKTSSQLNRNAATQSSNASTHSRENSLFLGMKQTKEEVLQTFGMSESIFEDMAAEADKEYQDMTFNKANLKRFTKADPPYAWNELSDKAKYEGIMRLSLNGRIETYSYWKAGMQEGDCPNSLARWFLYRIWRRTCPEGERRHHISNSINLDYFFVPKGSGTPLVQNQKPKQTKKSVEGLQLESTPPSYELANSSHRVTAERSNGGSSKTAHSGGRFLGFCHRRRPPSELSFIEEGSVHD